jgi:hypothetical protein
MMTNANWARRYLAESPRRCARPGCSASAAATLRFQPTRREAWLVPIDEHAPRTEGDLCARHAGALVLPRGWRLHDERGQLRAVELPAERVEEPAEPVHNEQLESDNLAELLDARTPLLRRAFESARASRYA